MASGLRWTQRANMGLIVGGVAMVGAALLMIVIATQVSIVGTTFYLTGAVLIVCAIPMFLMGWGNDSLAEDEKEIREVGVHGYATITALAPTGDTRHKDPEMTLKMRLELPGKPTYAVTKTDIVPQAFVGYLQPGRVISVHSAPNDPLKIAIDWDNLYDVPGGKQA